MRGTPRRSTFAAAAVALAALAPAGAAQAELPDARTHVDPATEVAGAPDPDSPRLTYLKSATDASDVRRGYLYVRARCDARCVVEVEATTKINGRRRVVATGSRELPRNSIRTIRLKIRSQYRGRISGNARFFFEATPLPVER
jgi:hypothetical protein